MHRLIRLFLPCFALMCYNASSAWATNITVQTSVEGAGDRITVLRGLVNVMLRETQERVSLKEGEELVVKRGGKTEKTEIDVQQESAKWQQALAKIGDAIPLGDLPEVIRQLTANQSEGFTTIQNGFKQRIAAETNTPEQIQEFRKNSDRLVGQMQEDQIILQALLAKVDQALAAGGPPAQLASYRKMLGQAQSQSESYQNELGKMFKTEFRSAITSGSSGADALEAQLQAVIADGEGIKNTLSANPAGLSQDWFKEAQDQANQELQELAELSVTIQAELEKNPADAQLLALAKQVAGRQSEIATLLRGLTVTEVSASTLTEIQVIEDQLSSAVLMLKSEIDRRNAIASGLTPEQLEKIDQYILEVYERVSELYLAAQRLYESATRLAAGQRYRTAEQEELLEMFERISNAFQQLGSAGETLQARLDEQRRLIAEAEAKSQAALQDMPPQLQLVDDMALPSPLGKYDYLAWGEWNASSNVAYTSRTDNYWIAGSLTPAAAIPTVGQATYSGQVLGKLNEAGSVSSVAGTTSLTADFGNRTLNGTFDNLTKNGAAWTSATVTAGWGAGTNQISGTVATANQMNGSVAGNFFGPTANHAGGTWAVSGGGNSASGVFVANKQPPAPN